MERWRCIAGCGACCRLDPALRGDDLDALDPDQRRLYLEMVGPDGWCIHFDTGGRRCRIYDSRPSFCRVENLVTLFGNGSAGPATQGPDTGIAPEYDGQNDGAAGLDPEGEALAIASCRCQIRAEYGGRGRVMKRFERAIRRQP
ncbi:MAG: YkgJ family cysteine cluster protein [Cyanobium sp.]